MEVVDQSKKAQASQNAKLDLCDYEIVDIFLGEGRHLIGPVKITPGEYILRVTHLNGECYQDLISNTEKHSLFSHYLLLNFLPCFCDSIAIHKYRKHSCISRTRV